MKSSVMATQGERWFSRVNALVLILVALLCLFPFYYVFIVSFASPAEVRQSVLLLFPKQWTADAYRYLFSTSAFPRATGVSLFLAIVGTACSLVITSMLSYGLSRKRLKGRRVLLLMILLTTLFNPGIIPGYLVVRDLGMINSVWSLIIPVLTSGWYVLLMKGFFDSIPAALEEAALIDGCNDFGVWYRIVLPLSLSSLAAFGLFYAVAYWNTFFTAVLYINEPEKWPLQILLQNMLIDSSTALGGVTDSALQDVPSQSKKMAAIIVSTVPILLVYPFLQKHFAKGAMVGSVKE
ncbi:carbohydrate ABC transporter permease [Cohnella thailandensis]|uniref:Carbohydrate ABC transporter permease n=1 Tax=Cohnella thailandensis TaxID=557557 RepID=A0A841SPU2_9BACL|nr:carbohydrate ABC transporter permease [Cohnella thailandensis]MBP1975457.1 putative aldouronate transport system permease protein [Cohnella thailandensis]